MPLLALGMFPVCWAMGETMRSSLIYPCATRSEMVNLQSLGTAHVHPGSGLGGVLGELGPLFFRVQFTSAPSLPPLASCIPLWGMLCGT